MEGGGGFPDRECNPGVRMVREHSVGVVPVFPTGIQCLVKNTIPKAGDGGGVSYGYRKKLRQLFWRQS